MSKEIDDLGLDNDELADNPTKRVPVCLCLDTSGSMDGDPINELNKGVELFYQAINEDEIAKQAADVCIVTFGDSGVTCVQDFQGIDDEIAPKFSANGGTPMGEGVNLAIDLLEQRKQEYKDNGVEYFQPWLVLMTDGVPTDNTTTAAQKTSDMANNKKLTIFPIGIGDGVNMDILRSFSPKRAPVTLKGLNFREFFKWLSQSVTMVSHSKPGEQIALPSNDTWATLD